MKHTIDPEALRVAYTHIVLGVAAGRTELLNSGLEALEKQIELCTPDWREEKPGSIKLVQPGTRFN